MFKKFLGLFLGVSKTSTRVLHPQERYGASVHAEGYTDDEDLIHAIYRAQEIMQDWGPDDCGNFAFDRLVEEILDGKHNTKRSQL